MERLLGKVPFTKVRVDDIFVSGRNDKEHHQNLNTVLMILSDNGFRLKLKKCVFMSPETEYLGFTISKDGVSPKKDKIEAIQDAPAPTNTAQVKSFLGMINYYHKHLPNLTTILEPLHRLLCKGVPWRWGTLEEVASREQRKCCVHLSCWCIMIQRSHWFELVMLLHVKSAGFWHMLCLMNVRDQYYMHQEF